MHILLSKGLLLLKEQIPNNDNCNNNIIKKIKIVVPLKHLSNFWRTLDMPLINCEVSFILTWSTDCSLTDLTTAAAVLDADPPVAAIASATGVTFKIINTKLHVPVLTLSAENDNKILEELKTGFKRTITWNKYRSEMSNQTRNNDLKI